MPNLRNSVDPDIFYLTNSTEKKLSLQNYFKFEKKKMFKKKGMGVTVAILKRHCHHNNQG